MDKGVSATPTGLSSSTEPVPVSALRASIPDAELPAELLAELSCLPEERPEDFTCTICEHVASNRWNYSARDYERPPICKSCESVTGYSWTGAMRHRTKPTGGTARDKREALRIAALADALAHEATRQQWEAKHGHA